MYRASTRRLLTSSLAAALVMGAVACGGDTETETTSPTPKITAFNASEQAVAAGATVNLTWSVANATSIAIAANPGGAVTVDPAMIATGSAKSAAIQADTTFTLTASDDAGHRATATAVVTLQSAPGSVTITSFTASPNPAPVNGMTTLRWVTVGATSIKINQGVTEIHSSTTNVAGSSSGSYAVTLTADSTTFTLVAENATGSANMNLTVTIEGTPPPPLDETEPNDTSAQANALPGVGAIVSASISSETDVDVFSVPVPEGGNITAETSDGMGGCLFDTVITLLGPDGTSLGDNDDVPGESICSRVHPGLDGFAANLPAGTYFVQVAGARGAHGGYTLAVSVGPKACGNFITEPGESCDDGNTEDGDTCSAACQSEVVGTINPPGGNDTVTIPAGGARFFSVVTTQASQSIRVTTTDAAGGCTGVDTGIGLIHVDQARLGDTLDDLMGGACAVIDSGRDTFANELPVGMYLLAIYNDGPVDASIEVNVTIVNPGCGNGILESSRQEQCDDGNTTMGDGCDASCQFQALGTLTGPPSDQTFNDAIVPATQQDFYAVVLTAPAYVIAETFAPTAGSCTSPADTVLELLDANHRHISGNNDAVQGPACSRIGATGGDLLMAGNYYVRVTSNLGQTEIPAYAVHIQTLRPGCGNSIVEPGETCDDGNTTAGDGCSATCLFEGGGNELEPNDVDAMATALGVTVGHEVLFAASIGTAGDVDYFAFDVVGAPASVEIVTHTSPINTASCDRVDTYIELHDATGATLAWNDDRQFPQNTCSRLDGTGGTPLDMGAANLPVGHYTIGVHSLDAIPTYFLTVTLE